MKLRVLLTATLTFVLAAHLCIAGADDAAHDFCISRFGMSPTNKTSLGASALPSWAANAFSKL